MSETAPAFERAEYAARLARTRAAMDKAGVEVLIAADPSNMNWLTGYDGWSFYVHQAVIVPPEGEPLWFGRPQDKAGARLTTFLDAASMFSYPDHYVQNPNVHPYQILAGVLRDKGLDKARIGVEMDNYYFAAKCLEVLREELPDARIVDATKDQVLAFKPQIAYFAAHRAEDQLEQLMAHMRRVAPDVPVILDAKRGDIGSTAEQYAKEAFERYQADAVTLLPFMGFDSVEP